MMEWLRNWFVRDPSLHQWDDGPCDPRLPYTYYQVCVRCGAFQEDVKDWNEPCPKYVAKVESNS